ncbi:MAG TPA: hypothetical protein VFE90_21570 [Myxococcales bacterium]|nr:hypothetical protein [Myxococcales bacterium]
MDLRLALVLTAALPAIAAAQQLEPGTADPASKPAEARTAPVMDGHLFAPSLLVDTPFRTTTFKLGILYGVGDATGPKYDINGNVIGQATYSFGDFGQTFRYEYAFSEWFSAGVVVLTNLYTGLDGPSVVSVGAQLGLGFGARVKAGHRFGPVETAVLVDVSTAPEFGVLVVAALLKALQDHVIEPGAAFQSTHTLTVTPSAVVSWAPWPALGLTANVAYVYKSLRLSGENIANQGGIQFAGLADFDFGKISKVPVGLLATYRILAPLGSDGVSRIEDVSGGIFYSARPELGLGLEIGWRSFTIRQPLASTVVLAQLGLQYYW